MVAAKFGQGLNMESSAREAERLLDLVGLSDKKDVLAKDLPVFSLKKLELARALASNPKVLLLDEVAAGATEAEVPRILGIISQIRKIGITVIMVEHVMKIIMKAVDRLIVMDKGVKIAEGFPNEIMENRTVIEAYLGKFAGHQGTPARGK
jgi:branched-chain amino acid transport system ATP-binding protein